MFSRSFTALSAALSAGLTISAAATGASTTAQPSELDPGTFHTFTGSNNLEIDYHYFENGNNGTLFYFDGDGTTNFHYPNVPANVHHEPGVGNGHVQRMNEEAEERDMDLVFLEHPAGGTSWWNGDFDADAYAEVVRELISATNDDTVQMVGYSGGSEFLVRHLLIDGPDWLPTQSAATMIGGGGLAGFPLQPPSERMQDMSYVWAVGEHDVEGAAVPETWSALRVSTEARNSFEALGYTNAELLVIPDTNHITYDFRSIVGDRLDALLAAS